WANVSVSQPLFSEGQTDDLWLHFAIVNDGKTPVDADLASSRIVVNGKKQFLIWAFQDLDEPGGRKPLAPGEVRTASASYNRGPLTGPGTYRIVWVGRH